MVLAELVESMLEAPGQFVDIATHDPISALLVAVGGLIITVSVGFFAILVAGALVELVIPDSSEKSHP